MSAGEEFIKWIRPAGAVLVISLFILVTFMLFTAKGAPVDGYTPSESAEYYSEHLDELCDEINDRLIPKMELSDVTAEVTDGKIAVSGEYENVWRLRFAVIHYFNEDLFIFEE